MKQILLILAVVACGGRKEKEKEEKAAKAKAVSEAKEESAKVIEATIRRLAKKPTGELTKADLEKITRVYLNESQLTDVKGLEKLTNLMRLGLSGNKLTSPRIRLMSCKRRCRIVKLAATPRSNRPHSSP